MERMAVYNVDQLNKGLRRMKDRCKSINEACENLFYPFEMTQQDMIQYSFIKERLMKV